MHSIIFLLVLVPAFQIVSSIQLDIGVDAFRKRYQEKKSECSEKCQEEMDLVWNDQELIIRMIDSSTKIPEGILNGRFYHLGDYDECLNTVSKEKNIYGKYCIGTIPPPETAQTQLFSRFTATKHLRMLAFDPNTIGLHTSVCYPSGCTAEDITKLSLINNFTSKFCYSKDTQPELSTGAITTMVVISIFLAITVVSTIFDCYLYYNQKKTPNQILIAFSALSNGRKLFASLSNQDQLLCLNGIKAISMMWVVIGHLYSNIAYIAPISNYLRIGEWENDIANMHIVGATVSVDTFFLVGGLVTVYTYMKAVNNGVKFNVFMYYLHRYLRLTPALLIVILFQAYLLSYVGEGPLWPAVDQSLGTGCRKNWWSALLYIQNFIGLDSMCVPQSWYLSVDMQLFLLSPIILVPLTKWPKQTIWGLGLLSVIGLVVPFVLGWVYELPGQMTMALASKDYMKQYYIQTYARFAPYTIGMLFGYFVYKLKNKETVLNLRPVAIISLWLVALTGLVACIYAGHVLYDYDYDKWTSSLFLAFNRPAWSVAVGLVILACVSGYGGPVNSFLSLPVFQFLTKVSYSMYLVHYAVITVVYASQKVIMRFSDFQVVMSFWGIFMLTLGLSIVLCLTFESPIIIIEKVIFGKGPKKENLKEVKRPQV